MLTYAHVCRLQQWRQRFQTLACVWMDLLSSQIQKWTLTAVEKDQVSSPSLQSLSSSHSSLPPLFISPSHSPTHTCNPGSLNCLSARAIPPCSGPYWCLTCILRTWLLPPPLPLPLMPWTMHPRMWMGAGTKLPPTPRLSPASESLPFPPPQSRRWVNGEFPLQRSELVKDLEHSCLIACSNATSRHPQLL